MDSTQSTPTEPVAGQNESFDPQGRLEGVDSAFEVDTDAPKSEGEQEHTEQEPENTEETQPQENTQQENTTQTPAQPAQPATPKLLAGKFKDEQELKNEFIKLGGNPAFYDTPEKLEQAYEARSVETTRVQNEIAERQRIEEAANAPKPRTAAEITQDVFKDIDFSKVENPTQLAQLMVQGVQQAIEQLDSQRAQAITPEQVAAKVQDTAKKQEALSYMESKVPRLATDQGFRRQFAFHIMGGRPQEKGGGQYPKSKEGLEEAMKDFLEVAQGIVSEAGKMNQQQTEIKNGATSVNNPGGGSGESTSTHRVSPEDDILGGIFDAFKEQQRKHGES